MPEDGFSAPETDAVLQSLDADGSDEATKAATVIRLMRAEHRRLFWETNRLGAKILEVANALAFDDRPTVGEDWPNYTRRVQGHLRKARAVTQGTKHD